MRLFGLIIIACLAAGCTLLKPVPGWQPERPVVIGSTSYDWSVPLLTDAVVDTIDFEGGAIIRVEPKLEKTSILFAGPQGRYVVEIETVAPNTSTVTLGYPQDSMGATPEIADGFFASLEKRLGMVN
jgi:hypothetical protein